MLYRDFLFREKNPRCLVVEDGEQHCMIPDDYDEYESPVLPDQQIHLIIYVNVYILFLYIGLFS